MPVELDVHGCELADLPGESEAGLRALERVPLTAGRGRADQVARVYAAARSVGVGEGAVVRLVPSGPTVQACRCGLGQV